MQTLRRASVHRVPFVALVVACSIFAIPAGANERMVLKAAATCKAAEGCVPMSFSVTEALEEKAVRRPSGKEYHELIEVPLNGRLENGPPREYVLEVESYTDGLRCDAFGITEVYSVGTSDDGQPLIKTDHGLLEVLDREVFVGCDNCLLRIDKATRATKLYFTPADDPSVTGMGWNPYRVAESGALYVLVEQQCVELPGAGRLRVASPSDCESARPLESFDSVAVETGLLIWFSAESRWLFVRVGYACT